MYTSVNVSIKEKNCIFSVYLFWIMVLFQWNLAESGGMGPESSGFHRIPPEWLESDRNRGGTVKYCCFHPTKKYQSCTIVVPVTHLLTHYLWWLFWIFCICLFLSIGCSCHFPAIFGSFRACFALACLHHQCGSSRHSLTHCLLLVAFQALSHWVTLSGVGTMSLETTGMEKVSILWLQYLLCPT